MKRYSLSLILLLASTLLLAACSTLPPPGIQPVSGFELTRYSGQWHEIARLDNRFERGLSQVSATYSLNADGSIKVVNRGYDQASASWKEAQGRALFNGDSHVASLKVSFFGPFYGGYHVVALDPDYQWAMVAGNDRDYLWILARDKQLPQTVTQPLLRQAASLGFDTASLIWVKQSTASQ